MGQRLKRLAGWWLIHIPLGPWRTLREKEGSETGMEVAAALVRGFTSTLHHDLEAYLMEHISQIRGCLGNWYSDKVN